jgi:hypothetical protein
MLSVVVVCSDVEGTSSEPQPTIITPPDTTATTNTTTRKRATIDRTPGA